MLAPKTGGGLSHSLARAWFLNSRVAARAIAESIPEFLKGSYPGDEILSLTGTCKAISY